MHGGYMHPPPPPMHQGYPHSAPPPPPPPPPPPSPPAPAITTATAVIVTSAAHAAGNTAGLAPPSQPDAAQSRRPVSFALAFGANIKRAKVGAPAVLTLLKTGGLLGGGVDDGDE